MIRHIHHDVARPIVSTVGGCRAHRPTKVTGGGGGVKTDAAPLVRQLGLVTWAAIDQSDEDGPCHEPGYWV